MKHNNKTIVITSREPFNDEGNSHLHYLHEITKNQKVIFINPPESWPPRKYTTRKPLPNLTVFAYRNYFPMRFAKRFIGKINDYITNYLLKKELGVSDFILWQFDPYYLSYIKNLNPTRLIYFPLDGYSKDPRDAFFAKR